MDPHSVKSVRIRNYYSLYFPAFGLNAESISPYSIRMRKNTDQNNSECGHFFRITYQACKMELFCENHIVNQFVLLHLRVLIVPHMFSSKTCHKRDVTCLWNLGQWRQNRQKVGAENWLTHSNSGVAKPLKFPLKISKNQNSLKYINTYIS